MQKVKYSSHNCGSFLIIYIDIRITRKLFSKLLIPQKKIR